MRSIATSAVLLLIALTASADIWFEPPAPDTRIPVRVFVNGLWCPPGTIDVVRSGKRITITARLDAFCPASPPPLEGFRIAADLGVLQAGTYSITAMAAGVALADATLTVREADPLFVVQPDVGDPAGGADVRIVGKTLVSCDYTASPPVCKLPNVTFDGIPSDHVALSNGYLSARVPPHSAGAVDVRLELGGVSVTGAVAFNYSGAAPEPAFFAPVLFPAVVTGAGAYGSQWQTDVSVLNGNAYALPVWQGEPLVGALTATVQSTWNFPAGRLLYIDRVGAAAAAFGTVVRDRSREATDVGSELPVVRENDLRAGDIELLNVPANPLYRVALRAFMVGGPELPRFAYVAVYAMSGGDAVVQDALTLTPQNAQLASAFVPDLLSAHPELAGKGPLRIRIGTGSSRPSAWAFASITNNETQHVTIISPQ